MGYIYIVMEICKTQVFAKWLDNLADLRGRAKIQVRIERLASGNPGNVAPVGEGGSELKIDYGPGYRVYYKKQGKSLILLLAGGGQANPGQRHSNRLAGNL